MNVRLAKTLRLGSTAIAFAAIAQIANATPTLTVLHNFDTNGYNPTGGPIMDSSGNLFGTTNAGGTYGAGTIYEYTAGGTYTVLYNFCPAGGNCIDGNHPDGTLIMDSNGSLYGTTENGGGPNKGGTIFMLAHSITGWQESVLYSFCSLTSCNDGFAPRVGLTYVGAASGSLYNGTAALYGVATFGGPNQNPATQIGGVVFKFVPGSSPTYTVLHGFPSCGTGCNDFVIGSQGGWAGLTTDSIGTLYGGADLGGDYVAGGLFKLTPSGSAYTYAKVLDLCASVNTEHSHCHEGRGVWATPTLGTSGKIYSPTPSGGTNGQGVAFVQSGTGTGGETELYTFCSTTVGGVCTDGAQPSPGSSLLRDSATGTLTGTTDNGGPGAGATSTAGGEIFQISNTGAFSVVYGFCNTACSSDGSSPFGSLWEDGSGNFYGVTQVGGSHNEGVLFKLTP